MMDIELIPVVTVSYNAPDLIGDLLRTFRRFYNNRIYVIDGSDEINSNEIHEIVSQYKNCDFIHFDFNIHHGPGMAWAISNLDLNSPFLVLDSDLSVVHGGFIESLLSQLEPQMYGVGQLNYVNRGGFDVSGPEVEGALLYLHPALMLCNIDVVKRWPLPVKHGAPMIEAMLALHDAGHSNLLRHVDWVREDFGGIENKNFIRHDWRGTVNRTGGYHLDEWMRSVMEVNLDRGFVSEPPKNFNHDLLRLIPINARGVVEVGCNNGALANAYKSINPSCLYTGIEIDEKNSELAKVYCDSVLNLDIESVGGDFFEAYSKTSNVWVFGDVLEHLRNPWAVLSKIRLALPEDGCVIVCLPNTQHWSVQAKLCVGDFRYDDSGLLDRTHLRFFTRATMFEMFEGAGLKIESGFPRIFGELKNENIISAIKLMALGVGADPELALQDAMPLQYVVKAVPAN
jgi:SAM-dependent methyltransferase